MQLFDGVYKAFVEEMDMDPGRAVPTIMDRLGLKMDEEGMPQWEREDGTAIKGGAAVDLAWRTQVSSVQTLNQILHAHQFIAYGGGFKNQDMSVRYQQIVGMMSHTYKMMTTYFGLRAFSDRTLLSLCASTPVTDMGGLRLDCIDPIAKRDPEACPTTSYRSLQTATDRNQLSKNVPALRAGAGAKAPTEAMAARAAKRATMKDFMVDIMCEWLAGQRDRPFNLATMR